jgi:hypothetical protein
VADKRGPPHVAAARACSVGRRGRARSHIRLLTGRQSAGNARQLLCRGTDRPRVARGDGRTRRHLRNSCTDCDLGYRGTQHPGFASANRGCCSTPSPFQTAGRWCNGIDQGSACGDAQIGRPRRIERTPNQQSLGPHSRRRALLHASLSTNRKLQKTRHLRMRSRCTPLDKVHAAIATARFRPITCFTPRRASDRRDRTESVSDSREAGPFGGGLLYERTIDIDTYDRHRDKLRAELTLAQMDRHSTELEEMDVEGILAFAERVLPNASNLWVQSSFAHKQRLQQVFFPEGTRFDGKGLLEPA